MPPSGRGRLPVLGRCPLQEGTSPCFGEMPPPGGHVSLFRGAARRAEGAAPSEDPPCPSGEGEAASKDGAVGSKDGACPPRQAQRPSARAHAPRSRVSFPPGRPSAPRGLLDRSTPRPIDHRPAKRRLPPRPAPAAHRRSPATYHDRCPVQRPPSPAHLAPTAPLHRGPRAPTSASTIRLCAPPPISSLPNGALA